MLNLYSGTPGSGKGYHIAKRVYDIMRHTKLNIICTCPMDIDTLALSRLGWIKKRLHDRFGIEFRNYNKVKLKGKFYYWTYAQMTPENLLLFAKRNHKRDFPKDKYQTLVIIDEGGIVFNCRDFTSKNRAAWIKFIPLHRHYGFDFVIAAQHDRQIDRQIRTIVDVEYRHRNLSVIPFISYLKFLFRCQIFMAFGYWYSTQSNKRLSTDIFVFRPQIGAIYNTLADMYDEMSVMGDKLPGGCADEDGGQGAPSSAAHRSARCTLSDIIARVKAVLKKRIEIGVPEDTVDLSQLFGRDIDVTEPIPRPGAAVPDVGVCSDGAAADNADADTACTSPGR